MNWTNFLYELLDKLTCFRNQHGNRNYLQIKLQMTVVSFYQSLIITFVRVEALTNINITYSNWQGLSLPNDLWNVYEEMESNAMKERERERDRVQEDKEKEYFRIYFAILAIFTYDKINVYSNLHKKIGQ